MVRIKRQVGIENEEEEMKDGWMVSEEQMDVLCHAVLGVTLSIHLILSSPLPVSISLLSMSVSPLVPFK